MKKTVLAALVVLAQVSFAKTVTFTIKPGTGTGAWNTSAETLVLETGDFLNLVNGDSVEHALHTGGKPCEHSDYLQPGQSQKLEMTGTWNPETDKPLYDHFHQSTGFFWLKVIEKSELEDADSEAKVVTFVVQPGTGAKAWNTPETKLTLHVGDTLRVVNQDTVDHAIHTGGKPFPHTRYPYIKPGESQDHKVTDVWDLEKNGPLYDHFYQEAGFIYLEVLP